MLDSSRSYSRRCVTARPVVCVAQLHIKPYEIHLAETSATRLRDVDWQALLSAMLPVAPGRGDEAAGFAIAHYARDGNYLLASTWYERNMLKHGVRALHAVGTSWTIAPLADAAIMACVWEMQIMAFERDAWVRTMMSGMMRDDSLNDYLECRLRGWI